MSLATLRTDSGTVAARVDGDQATEIPGFADVGAPAAATRSGRRSRRGGRTARRTRWPTSTAGWARSVPRPGKIVCVGLNYRNHILEMGRELPEHPTLFAKYPEALIGPYDDIVLPRVRRGRGGLGGGARRRDRLDARRQPR